MSTDDHVPRIEQLRNKSKAATIAAAASPSTGPIAKPAGKKTLAFVAALAFAGGASIATWNPWRSHSETSRERVARDERAPPRRPDMAPVPDDLLPAASLTQAPRVAGVVSHAITDQPVAGARLYLEWRDPLGLGFREIAETTTDAAGEYSFASWQLEDSWRDLALRAECDGFVPTHMELWWSQHGHVYLAPGVRVDGRVVDPEGRGVGGASVWLRPDLWADGGGNFAVPGLPVQEIVYWGYAPSMPLLADSDGRFTSWVGAGPLAFEAAAPGLAPGFSAPIFPVWDETTQVEIRLATGSTLRGQVHDEAGAPIAGALVLVEPVPRDVDPDRSFVSVLTKRHVETDAGGGFAIGGLSERCRRITVTHPEYADLVCDVPAATQDPCDLVLSPGRWLTGRLVLPDGVKTTAPRHARLVIPGWLAELELFVGEDLAFRSAALEPEITAARLLVPGFVPIELAWSPGPGPHDVGSITLDRGRSVVVHAHTSEGQRIAGARVRIFEDAPPWTVRAHGVTRSTGHVTLSGLLAGRYRLMGMLSGFAEDDATVTLGDGVEPPTVELEMAHSATVRGRLVMAGDQRLPPAFISARTANDRWGVHARPHVTGDFVIRNVTARLPATFTATPQGAAAAWREIEALRPGEVRDLGIVALEPGVALDGRVVDDDGGAPVAGAFVTARLLRSLVRQTIEQGNQVAKGSANGAFRLTGLEPGEYEITTQARGYAATPSARMNILKGQTPIPIELRLPRAVRYQARVTSEDGKPVAGARILVPRTGNDRSESMRLAATTDSDGAFELEDLSPAKPQLAVEHPDYLPATIGDADASGLPETITLLPAAVLEIAAVAVDDRPPAGAVSLHVSSVSGGAIHGQRWRKLNGGGTLRVSDLAAGTYKIVLVARGGAPSATEEVTLEHGRTVSIVVRVPDENARFPVRIIDTTGVPVVGASIDVWRVPQDIAWDWVSNTHTDADGVGSVRGVVWEETVLVVTARGQAPEVVDLRAQDPRPRLDVQLAPEAVLIVGAMGADGFLLTPLEAKVTHKAKQLPRVLLTEREAQKDDRRLRFAGLAAGTYEVRLSRGEVFFGSFEVTLREGETRTADCPVEAPLLIAGRVLIDGTPPAAGKVSIRLADVQHSLDAPVNSDGSFYVETCSRGAAIFSVDTGAFRHVEQRRINEGEEDLRIEISTGRVTGRVLGAAAQPVPRFHGQLEGPRGGASFATGADGRFVLSSVPAGVYRVSMRRVPPGLYFAPQEVTVTPGATSDFVISAVAARLLQIEATNRLDAPLTVSMERWLGGQRIQLASGATPGTFYWPSGESGVGFVMASGYAPALVDVPAVIPLAAIPMTLRCGTDVHIRVRARDGSLRIHHAVSIVPEDGLLLDPRLRDLATSDRGDLHVKLRPGRYAIRTTLTDVDDSPWCERAIDVVADQPVDLVLP